MAEIRSESVTDLARNTYPRGHNERSRGRPPDSSAMQQVLARLADAHDQIAYLRTLVASLDGKLDQARDELTAERAKVTALLTDQRTAPPAAPSSARRSWWPWRRG
jgi:hypothetical protein